MHPLFSRLAGVAGYLALWLVIGLAGAIGLVHRGGWPWLSSIAGAVPLALAYGVVCLAAWYVCRDLPIDRARSVGRALLGHAGAACFTSAVWVIVGQWWLALVGLQVRWSRDASLLLFGAGALLFLVSSAMHYVFLAVEAQEAARRQALESAVLAREAELRALRAQVNPHFLFNSLHSIGSLAGTRPAAAREMAIALGEFLRHSLRLGGLASVPLQQEIDLVAQYLSIEQVRFGERLQVQIDVEPAAGATHVPPLLLQPLVENAIKHGVAGLLEAGLVSIRAHRQGAQCVVSVVNAFDPEAQPRAGTGTGLRNVRDRLTTHYGPAAAFDARPDGDRFTVTLAYPGDDVALRPRERA